MKRSVETERGRIVAALMVASLLQDACLFVANFGVGISRLLETISTSFGNFAQTFSWLFNDQASKYRDLTGRDFATRGIPVPVAVEDEESEEEDE